MINKIKETPSTHICILHPENHYTNRLCLIKKKQMVLIGAQRAKGIHTNNQLIQFGNRIRKYFSREKKLQNSLLDIFKAFDCFNCLSLYEEIDSLSRKLLQPSKDTLLFAYFSTNPPHIQRNYEKYRRTNKYFWYERKNKVKFCVNYFLGGRAKKQYLIFFLYWFWKWFRYIPQIT